MTYSHQLVYIILLLTLGCSSSNTDFSIKSNLCDFKKELIDTSYRQYAISKKNIWTANENYLIMFDHEKCLRQKFDLKAKIVGIKENRVQLITKDSIPNNNLFEKVGEQIYTDIIHFPYSILNDVFLDKKILKIVIKEGDSFKNYDFLLKDTSLLKYCDFHQVDTLVINPENIIWKEKIIQLEIFDLTGKSPTFQMKQIFMLDNNLKTKFVNCLYELNK